MDYIVDRDLFLAKQAELFPMLPRRAQCREERGSAPVIRRCTPAMLRKYPYIRINPPKLAMWLGFDIDRPGALMAWEEAGLPPPACGAADPQSTRGHLLYPLDAPVLVGDGARDAPLRYLAAVEAGMRARLEADPQFSAGSHSVKNPWHDTWRTYWGPAHAWGLGELAEWVDLPRHLPKRGLRVESIGYGRNCALFDRLRLWAYRAIRRYWGGGERNYIFWAQCVYGQALEMNGDLGQVGGSWHSLSGPMDEKEVYHIAKHVSSYVWKKFSPEKFSEIQKGRRAAAESVKKQKELESWLLNIKSKDQ